MHLELCGNSVGRLTGTVAGIVGLSIVFTVVEVSMLAGLNGPATRVKGLDCLNDSGSDTKCGARLLTYSHFSLSYSRSAFVKGW